MLNKDMKLVYYLITHLEIKIALHKYKQEP